MPRVIRGCELTKPCIGISASIRLRLSRLVDAATHIDAVSDFLQAKRNSREPEHPLQLRQAIALFVYGQRDRQNDLAY